MPLCLCVSDVNPFLKVWRSVNTSFFTYRTEASKATSGPLRGCRCKYFQAEARLGALKGSLGRTSKPWFVAEVSLTSQHILNMFIYYSITVVNWSISSGRGVLPVRATKSTLAFMSEPPSPRPFTFSLCRLSFYWWFLSLMPVFFPNFFCHFTLLPLRVPHCLRM